MVKQDLIDMIARNSGLTRKDASSVVELFIDRVISSLASGEKVSITGFGTFDISTRKARAGVNPRTGEKIQIPEMKSAHFRPSPKMKDFIRNNEQDIEIPLDDTSTFNL